MMHRSQKPMLIICNGKSAKDINWDWLKKNEHKFDTFGMNSAYRMFDKMNFYPTYYANLDDVVLVSHKNELQRILDEKRCKKCFYLRSCAWQKYSPEHYVFTENETYVGIKKTGSYQLSSSFDNFKSWGNTGSDSVQIAIMLGYTNIYIIGVDGYVEQISDAAVKNENNKKTLEIIDTPEDNPNYWFAEYQSAGDEYNFPNATSVHIPGLEVTSMICNHLNIQLKICLTQDYVFISFTLSTTLYSYRSG